MRSGDARLFTSVFESCVASEVLKEKIAISFADRELTYEKLNQAANQMARFLLNNYHLAAEEVVIIALPRSIEAVVAILAVMKAGGAFCLLAIPEQSSGAYVGLEQFKYKVNFIRPKLIISDELSLSNGLFAPEFSAIDITTEEITKILEEFPSANLGDSEVTHSLERLAYITFTSGTTGNRPRGVLIEHMGLYSRLLAHQELIKLKAGDKVAQYCPLNVDASIMEIMLALGTGAELIIIPPIKNDDDLADYYTNSKISVAIFTPSTLKQLLPRADSVRVCLADSAHLRCILTTGEQVTAELLNKWSRDFRLIINGYGPCEVTIATSLYVYDSAIGEVTVGKPIDGIRKAIVNYETLLPITDATEEGELVLGGLGVGRGYLVASHVGVSEEGIIELNKLNSRQFLESTHELNYQINLSGEAPVRWYRTGDRVKLNEKGEIIFLGRYGNELKIRGVRVTTEYIANFIGAHPFIASSLNTTIYVYLREVDGKAHIVAGIYHNEEITEEKLLSLAKHALGLERTFIPHRWYLNNLVDLRIADNWKSMFGGLVKSKAPKELRLARAKPRALLEPLSELHNELLEIWRQILLTEEERSLAEYEFSIDDNFIFMGGDSLAEKHLVNEFSRRYPTISFPEKGFSENPTIRYLASYVYQCANPLRLKDLNSEVIPRSRKPALYFIHPVTGEVIANYRSLVAEFMDRKAFGVEARSYPNINYVMNSIPRIAADYLKAIIRNSSATDGSSAEPIVVIGHSAGGVIAYELAIQLEKTGLKAIAILLDTLSPRFIRSLMPAQSIALVKGLAQAMISVYGGGGMIEPISEEAYAAIAYAGHENYLSDVFNELIKRAASPEIRLKLISSLNLALAIWNYHPSSKPKSTYLWVAKKNDWCKHSELLGWKMRAAAAGAGRAAVEKLEHDHNYEVEGVFVQDTDHNNIVTYAPAKNDIKMQIERLAPEPPVSYVLTSELKLLEDKLAATKVSRGSGTMAATARLFSTKAGAAAGGAGASSSAPTPIVDSATDVITRAIKHIDGPSLEERTALLFANLRLPIVYHRGRRALEELKELMASDATVITGTNLRLVALTGAPGAGKTELAKDYGHHYYSRTGNLVLCFSDELPLDQHYQAIAKEKLDFNVDIEASTAKSIVRKILEKNPGFLLIFDNIQNINQLKDHLNFESTVRGQILITARKHSILPSGYGRSLDISAGLKKEEAMEKLLVVKKGEEDVLAAELLAKKMGFLPLGIDQALRYIAKKQRTLHSYSIRAYYDELDKDPSTLWIFASRPEGYHFTYETAILMTLEHVDADTVEIMKLLPLLNYNRIPISLIKQWALHKKLRESEREVNFLVNSAIANLDDLGLVRSSEESINIHLVIQEVLRVRLYGGSIVNELIFISEVLIQTLSKIFRHQADSVRAGRVVVAHAEEVLKHLLELMPTISAPLLIRDIVQKVVSLLHWLGTHYERNNLYLQSTIKYTVALELCEKYKDLVEKKQLAHIYHSLGSIEFRTLANLEKGEKYLEKCLALRKELCKGVFDDDSFEKNGYNPVLHAMHNLGYLLIHYVFIDDYRIDREKRDAKLLKARMIFDNILITSDNPEGRPEKSKIRQPFYLVAAYINSGNIARLLDDQDRATKNFGFAKALLERMQAEPHFEMAEAYNNFGLFYLKGGVESLVKAQEAFEHSKRICEKFMDPKEKQAVSLHLSNAYEGLARVSLMRKDYHEAIKNADASLAYRRMIYTLTHCRVHDAERLIGLIQQESTCRSGLERTVSLAHRV